MTTQNNAIDAVVHIFDGSRGVYIPQAFGQHCNENWHGVSAENRQTLINGPDDEWYWEAWDSVLNSAYFEKDGNKWTLYQDGDLWAMCYELMSDEEKRNFGMDE